MRKYMHLREDHTFRSSVRFWQRRVQTIIQSPKGLHILTGDRCLLLIRIHISQSDEVTILESRGSHGGIHRMLRPYGEASWPTWRA